jgi:exodeoxyribonuclease VIII
MLLDMPFSEYLNHPAISRSDVSNWLKYDTPKKYKYFKDNPPPVKSSMFFGSLVHTLILEPEKYGSEYVIYDGAKRDLKVKKYADFVAKNPGKTPILRSEFDKAVICSKSVMNHEEAPTLLAGGQIEKTLLFTWEGIEAKARFDIWNKGMIWDLKTAKDASEKGFGETARNYYRTQAGWYFAAAELSGLNPEGFGFIVVENEPPFDVQIFVFTQEEIDLGREEALAGLRDLAHHKANDFWPGYSAVIKTI